MVDQKTVAIEDYNRMEIEFASYLDTHPQQTREQAYLIFKAGWMARIHAARASIGSYSVDGADAVMYETMRLLEKHINHLDRLVYSNYRVGNERARRIEDLQRMIRESGKDPVDAPLWRRVSEQRREIKRLAREIAALKAASTSNEQEQGR